MSDSVELQKLLHFSIRILLQMKWFKVPFKSIKYEHIFTEEVDFTVMTDLFHFEAPLGIFGKLANVFFEKVYDRFS